MNKQDIDIEKTEGADEINLRSEEVQEIMGRIPSWIERWGITVIGLLLIVILTGAVLFPYPDKLTGQFLYESGFSTHHSKIIGHAFLPAHGIGKVKKGQEARIRLENYPDGEFGYLNGKVYNIAKIPDENGLYEVEILFPNGLETSNGIQLPTDRQLIGTTEIVMSDKRLIERMKLYRRTIRQE